MPDAMPAAELLLRQGDATPMSTDEATVKPWSQARMCLETAPKIWLSTVRPNGRPHVMPVLLVWAGDTRRPRRSTTRPVIRPHLEPDRDGNRRRGEATRGAVLPPSTAPRTIDTSPGLLAGEHLMETGDPLVTVQPVSTR